MHCNVCVAIQFEQWKYDFGHQGIHKIQFARENKGNLRNVTRLQLNYLYFQEKMYLRQEESGDIIFHKSFCINWGGKTQIRIHNTKSLHINKRLTIPHSLFDKIFS